MVLENWARGIERWARPLATWLSSVGTVALVVMMFWVVLDVTSRFFFNSPLLGSYEIVEYLMAVFIFFAFGSAQFHKSHINVSLAVDSLPPRARGVVDTVTNLVMLVMFALMVWGSWLQALDDWSSGVSSSVLMIPKWPFELVATVGFVVLIIAVMVDVLRSASHIGGGRSEDRGDSISQF